MNSLKFKIIIGFFIGGIIGTAAMINVVNRAFQGTIDTISQQALQNAREVFKSLEASDTRMLSAALTALLDNEQIKNVFIQKDREKLMALAGPLYKKLESQYGITHWYFLFPENAPGQQARTCFLRVHSPALFDDVINRSTYQNAVKNRTYASGIELGKTAFALRVVHPYYDAHGAVVGYLELGEEIDHFFKDMKKQTGCEFGLLVRKEYLDEKDWASVRRNKGLPNNWDERQSVLLIDKTTKGEEIIHYNGDLTELPEEGEIIDIHHDAGAFMHGLFPLYDAGGRKVGGVFVIKDITQLYASMQGARRFAVMVIVGLMGFLYFFVIVVLSRWIFSRLDRAIDIITRVIGGDYNAKVTISAKDEIGKIESSFEQLRVLFVSVLKAKEPK